MDSNSTNPAPRIWIRKTGKAPYVVDKSELRRFDTRNAIFERITWDSLWKGYARLYNEKAPEMVAQGKPGYSRVDFALAYASWIVHDSFEAGFSWKKIRPYREPKAALRMDWTETRLEVADPGRVSTHIKRAAKLFGASLVGICGLREDWLYADTDFPDGFDNTVVMAVEMSADGIATSPAAPAAAATGVGYSKMAFVLAGVGEFIRNLGYGALQCGNDTALSIPLAIDAGLGELGRNGLLITPRYGPRIRLCKIVTDLPLASDEPIEFGVREFCARCKLCAEHCEADAISKSDEPSFEVACRSNNPGALKWYVDAEKCYLYWCENGIDCSTCIKVCPYSLASGDQLELSSEQFWNLGDNGSA